MTSTPEGQTTNGQTTKSPTSEPAVESATVEPTSAPPVGKTTMEPTTVEPGAGDSLAGESLAGVAVESATVESWTPRRVVTGHDEAGTSVFLSDGAPPVVRTAPDGALFYEMWNTGTMPAPIAATEPEPTERSLTVPPDPNGTKIRINEFPPGAVSPMHRTQSVDYGIVLDGEITLVLDESETVLRAGDVVVQRGTDHRWENRSKAATRMAFILVDGVFTDDLKASLAAGALESLMDDPMHA